MNETEKKHQHIFVIFFSKTIYMSSHKINFTIKLSRVHLLCDCWWLYVSIQKWFYVSFCARKRSQRTRNDCNNTRIIITSSSVLQTKHTHYVSTYFLSKFVLNETLKLISRTFSFLGINRNSSCVKNLFWTNFRD